MTFTFTVSNTSEVDTLTVSSLEDSVFGNLDGQGDCSVPQQLPPAERYTCRADFVVAGAAGDTHINQLTASGTSDDGVPVSASALVRILAAIQGIPALGQAGLLLLVLAAAAIAGLTTAGLRPGHGRPPG